MTKYRYTGKQVTCLPLKSGDVLLHPGQTVDLPADHEVVATLVAKKWLVPVTHSKQSAKKES